MGVAPPVMMIPATNARMTPFNPVSSYTPPQVAVPMPTVLPSTLPQAEEDLKQVRIKN